MTIFPDYIQIKESDITWAELLISGLRIIISSTEQVIGMTGYRKQPNKTYI